MFLFLLSTAFAGSPSDPPAPPPPPGGEAQPSAVPAPTPADEAIGQLLEAAIDSQLRWLDRDRDAWLRPVLGARFWADQGQHAWVVGLHAGVWRRFTSGKLTTGLSSRLRYTGAVGPGRGRSFDAGTRWVACGGPLSLEVGAGLWTDRHETRAQTLPGVVSVVPDARLRLGSSALGVTAGAAPAFFVSGARAARDGGPLPGFGDELTTLLALRILAGGVTWNRTYTTLGPVDTITLNVEI
jgi:hypothetical protein